MKTLPPKTARAGLLVMLAGLVAGLTGCETPRAADMVLGPGQKPANVYLATNALPGQLRRVAVLPMTTDVAGAAGEHGVESLTPVVQGELLAARQFELVFVTPAQLQQWTGKRAWNAEENLPPDCFDRLRQKLGCDGVLFVRLTTYRAYPPLAVGWNVKLCDTRRRAILWSVDELFDAGEAGAVNGARRYYQAHTREQSPLNDSRNILDSPRRFGQYAFATVLETLPPRAESEIAAKVRSKSADK